LCIIIAFTAAIYDIFFSSLMDEDSGFRWASTSRAMNAINSRLKSFINVYKLPVQVWDQMAPKCILLERNHYRRPTAIAVDCPIDSRQWWLDDHETDLDGSSVEEFDESALSLESTADLSRVMHEFDTVMSVHLSRLF
jgi:hypothetical protein